MGNGMDDAMKLEGYLMKEKSNLSLLHGLTGDVNKRYFRIRRIERSEELALCYYKNIADPEVRGWIYLKDVTEIAQHQDTIILTSVARTLHLYAETRAQHNQWVMGLAKLCPDAFAMLGRNAPVGTTLDRVPPRGSARTSPTKTRTAETSLTKDRHESPIDVPAADVSVARKVSSAVDEEGSGPSTAEDHGRVECFGTPREHDKGSRRQISQRRDKSSGGHREPRERRVSYHMATGDSQKSDARVSLAGDKGGAKDRYLKRRSSDGDRGPQRSSSGFTKRDELSRKERMRYRKEKLGRRPKGSEDQSEINADIVDEADTGIAGSPTSRYRSTGDTENEGNGRSPIQSEPPGRRTGLEASGTRNNTRGKVEEKEEVEQRSGLLPSKSTRDDIDSDTVIEQERGIGTSGGEGVVVQEEAHVDGFTKRSRIYSSDNENVETIELSEGPHYNEAGDHAKDGDQQQSRDHAPTDVRKGSNQDEDKEFDDDEEIDREVPQLEIGNWGNPQPGQSATCRLHRHLMQSSTEAGNLEVSIPPPKEFLTQGSLQPAVREKHDAGRATTNAGQYRDTEETRSADTPKSASNGRRRTAADLEWSDGGETPDRPRCVEEKLTHPVICEPVDLGDSDEEGKDDLDLEVEKQRRRAAAALVALEAAAKEADEGAQLESEPLARCKPKSEGGVRGVAKAYPSPAAPPPPSLVRKGRRGQGVPPPGVAPPKAVRPPLGQAANHRAVPDDNFVRDDWDDEIKTPCHGSPVSGGRDTGGLPAATTVGATRNQANNWTQFDD